MGCCGKKCIKYTLLIFTFLFLVAGAALLGLGIWFMVDEQTENMLEILGASSDDELYRAAAYTAITLGALIFVTSLFGCVGAFSECTWMLAIYGLICGILLILEIVVGVLAVVFQSKLNDGAKDAMNQTLQEKYKYGVDDDGVTNAWDYLQVELKCCGAYGYADWATSMWASTPANNLTVPWTCCKLDNSDYKNPDPSDGAQCQFDANTADLTSSQNLYMEGCVDSIVDWVKKHGAILVGIAFGCLCLPINGINLSCQLRRLINKSCN